jgi:hypothetical protein
VVDSLKVLDLKRPIREADIDKRVYYVAIAEKSKRRSRQTLGIEKLRAQIVDLVARKFSTQQYKHCHGKFA